MIKLRPVSIVVVVEVERRAEVGRVFFTALSPLGSLGDPILHRFHSTHGEFLNIFPPKKIISCISLDITTSKLLAWYESDTVSSTSTSALRFSGMLAKGEKLERFLRTKLPHRQALLPSADGQGELLLF